MKGLKSNFWGRGTFFVKINLWGKSTLYISTPLPPTPTLGFPKAEHSILSMQNLSSKLLPFLKHLIEAVCHLCTVVKEPFTLIKPLYRLFKQSKSMAPVTSQVLLSGMDVGIQQYPYSLS